MVHQVWNSEARTCILSSESNPEDDYYLNKEGPTMRLKMKVWTDPDSRDRYLMPAAFITPESFHSDRPVMKAYAMNDDDTKVVEIYAEEWNQLPFFYFKEDGEAARPEHTRRPDMF